MAARKRQISLLPQEGFESTTLGRVLTWSLNTGRFIVIITELVVILAFLSRFWLDRTLTDLNEQIGQKVNLIKATKTFEEQYRLVQQRLLSIKEISQKPDFGHLTKTILAQVPTEVKLDKISVAIEEIQITGLSLSETGIEIFINQLDKQKLGQVKITQLTTGGEEPGIKFALNIKR